MLLESSNIVNQNYVIVFDLDETLGHFSQLYIFWNLLNSYLNDCNIEKIHFFKLLDLFPDFLRPNILKLLKNVKRKKQKNICNYVMIYTNNNGPKHWAELIKEYFHHKLKYNLFDKIIGAFKVNGEIIEVCRTSNGKSFSDFLNCTKLPENTQICFLDDQHHENMEHENVVYINIKPYTHNESFIKMAEKFYNNNKDIFNKKNINSVSFFINYIKKYTNNYNLKYIKKSKIEKNIDYILGSQIIKEVDKFFKTKPHRYTKKYKKKSKNKTYKIL